MRRLLFPLVALATLLWGACQPSLRTSARVTYAPRDGDFLFQALPHNALIDAIEGSTESPFSHCGIVVQRGPQWMVLEAIGPVRETPLKEWIAQGRGDAYAAYRLEPPLAAKIPAIITAAERYAGRPYDIHYDLDDERIYCSELIWKATRDATGVELGQLQQLGQLKWQPYEGTIRYLEKGNLPLSRRMITPRSLTEDRRLTEIRPYSK